MEEAARRYARRILLLHVLLLLLIAGAVAVAARQVYQRARDEVIQQAAGRQELLASQTARGIQNYYSSILDNLDLIKRGEQDEQQSARSGIWFVPDFGKGSRVPLAMAPLLWHQLEGRVSHLFGWRTPGRVFAAYPREKQDDFQKLPEDVTAYLRREDLGGEMISPFYRLGESWGHLVVVPVAPTPAAPPGGEGRTPPGARGRPGGDGRTPPGAPPTPAPQGRPGNEGRTLLVAVVPVEPMQQRFLNDLNRGLAADRPLNAILLDENNTIMAGLDPASVGTKAQPVDSAGAQERTSAGPGRRTLIFREPVSSGGKPLPPRMVSIEQLTVGGRTWTLRLSSRLSDVDQLVGGIFRHALWWSIGLVVAVTAVLVSSSTQLIRSRLRVERMKNELLDHELREARRIQLAWLPQPARRSDELDIAAVNEPARHISGDFYDWFELPDGRNVVTIGDVTGHGLSGAFLMATTQLLIRNTMQRLPDPGECLTEVNRQLCGQVFNGQFVTVLVMVLDLERGTLEAASAGHFPPILSAEGSARSLDLETGLVLGVERDENYTTSEFALPERFALLLYTDGVTDAPSLSGGRYGSDGLHQAVRQSPAPARDLVDQIVRDIRQFSNARILDDDLTMVAVCGQTAVVAA